MKAREFWVTEGYPSEEATKIYKRGPWVMLTPMKVREVLPIDWDKIFDHLNADCALDARKEIIKRVEAALKGDD